MRHYTAIDVLHAAKVLVVHEVLGTRYNGTYVAAIYTELQIDKTAVRTAAVQAVLMQYIAPVD